MWLLETALLAHVPADLDVDRENVVLAVEVASPDSEVRDRGVKPRKYAEAGGKHFWRVEQGADDLPVVHVYELDPATDTYTPTGIHRKKMNLDVPFSTDVDLSETYRRGRP